MQINAPLKRLMSRDGNVGDTLVCDCEDPAWAEDGETFTIEGGETEGQGDRVHRVKTIQVYIKNMYVYAFEMV